MVRFASLLSLTFFPYCFLFFALVADAAASLARADAVADAASDADASLVSTADRFLLDRSVIVVASVDLKLLELLCP